MSARNTCGELEATARACPSADRVVSFRRVAKRFCRVLRRSAIYAVTDSLHRLGGRSPSRELRSGEYWALHDTSFEIAAGECLAIVGHNGAGKSTLARIAAGVLLADQGQVRIHPNRAAVLASSTGLHPLLTGRENIYLWGSLLGMTRRQVRGSYEAIVDFSELHDWIGRPLRLYSQGMIARLSYSVAAHVDARLLILDEALAVGDEAFREKCFDHLLRLKRSGTSLLIVSHSRGAIRRLADRALWLERGRTRRVGSPDEILEAYHPYCADGASQPAADLAQLPSASRNAHYCAAPSQDLPIAADGPVEESVRNRSLPKFEGLELDGRVLRSDSTWEFRAHECSTLRGRLLGELRRDAQKLELLIRRWVPAADADESETLAGTQVDLPKIDVSVSTPSLAFQLKLTPHLASGQYRAILQVTTETAGRSVRIVQLALGRCRVSGREGSEGLADLCASLDVVAAENPECKERGAEDGEFLSRIDPVLPGERIPIEACVVAPTAAVSVCLRVETQTCELVYASPPRELPPCTREHRAVRLRSSFAAHLTPGEYVVAFAFANALGESVSTMPQSLTVLQDATALGHVDLEARGRFATPADFSATHDLRPTNAQPRVSSLLGVRPGRLELLGTDPRLDVVRGGPEMRTWAARLGDRTIPFQCLEGESIEGRWPLSLDAGRSDVGVTFRFRESGGADVAGFRLAWNRARQVSSSILEFHCRMNLAPGDYDVDVSLTSSDAAGVRDERDWNSAFAVRVLGSFGDHGVTRPDCDACRVNEYPVSMPGCDTLSDGTRLTATLAPSARPEALDSGMPVENLLRQFKPASLAAPLLLSGRPVRVRAAIARFETAASPISRCKFSFQTAGGTRVAVWHSPVDTSVPNRKSNEPQHVEWRVNAALHLAPGWYDWHVAWMEEIEGRWKTVAGLPRAAVVCVPQRGRPQGVALVEAELVWNCAPAVRTGAR